MITSKFLFGGKAIFTVTNNVGKHYTYKIFQSRKAKKETPHLFQVFLKKGDLESYMGKAEYNVSNNTYNYTTAESYYRNDEECVRVFVWAIKQVFERKELPNGYTINHAGFCCRCGRELTIKESVELGIGPICNHNKLNKNHVRTKNENEIFTRLVDNNFKDIIDVYLGQPSDTKFNYCCRVVFKSGEDVYTNINGVDDVDLISDSIMIYRLDSFLN